MIINCFEKDENNGNVWHRSISNGKGWINLASLKDEDDWIAQGYNDAYQEFKDEYQKKKDNYFFTDDNGKTHPMCGISTIVIDPKFLTVMVYDEDFNASQVYVSNEAEKIKVRDYLDKNKF